MCLILIAVAASAQGGWNIGYIPADSLNKKHVGRIVRIDFKTTKANAKISAVSNIRSYLTKVDTVQLIIDSSVMTVVERRKIKVDNGNYDEQYLECLDCKDLILRFYDAEILEIEHETILFKLDRRHTNIRWNRAGKGWVEVRIDRNKIDGVFYRTE